MTPSEQNDLVHALFRGKLSRQAFVSRALALGMSAATRPTSSR